MAGDVWMAQVRAACETVNREYPNSALMAALENFEMVAEEYDAALMRLVQQATVSGLSILARKHATAAQEGGGDGG